MDKKLIAIFLDYFDDLRDALPVIKKIIKKPGYDYVVISLNFDNSILKTLPDLRIIYFDELLLKEDYAFMYEYVFNLTRTWYLGLKPIEKITEYKGTKFGEIAMENAQRFFTLPVKNLEIVLKIIKRLNPEKIILVGDKDIFEGLLRFIKKQFNISACFVKVNKKMSIFVRILENFRQYLLNLVCAILDNFIRNLIVRKKINNAILIDTRLYLELKDIGSGFRPVLYLIERGFRIRITLLKKKLFFAPTWNEGPSSIFNIFSPFNKNWLSVKKDLSYKNEFIYKDLAIWEVLEKFINKLLVNNFSITSKNIRFFERLYEKLKPRLVILREAVRMLEKTIVSAAKNSGITTFVIQHGTLVEGNVYTTLYSDWIALWGGTGIEWYSSFGNDTTKCKITGKPGHDLLYREKNSKDKMSKELLRMGLRLDKDIIVYIASYFKKFKYPINVYYFQDSEYVILNSILSAASEFAHKQFIIKVHPFDPIDIKLLFERRLKKYSNVFIVKNINATSLIKMSSLVITAYFSSASLDAVILNKPVIAIKLYKDDEVNPLVKEGLSIGVSPKDLSLAIRQISENKEDRAGLSLSRQNFIYNYVYKLDGNSNGRVKEAISEICRGVNIAMR